MLIEQGSVIISLERLKKLEELEKNYNKDKQLYCDTIEEIKSSKYCYLHFSYTTNSIGKYCTEMTFTDKNKLVEFVETRLDNVYNNSISCILNEIKEKNIFQLILWWFKNK